jgi:hypothetical protein
VTTAGASHFYECSEHGGWWLEQDGRLYPIPALAALHKMRDKANPSKA